MSTPENTPEKKNNLDDLLPGELVSPEEARPIKRAQTQKEEGEDAASTPAPDSDETQQAKPAPPAGEKKTPEAPSAPKPQTVPAAAVEKPKFKVTRSPFAPKIGDSPSTGSETSSQQSAKHAGAAPSPIAAKSTARPSAPKSVRGHIPVEEDSKINPGVVALDLIASAVAITCAVIIFANLGT